MPKVSVCIPTYNRKKYLLETLNSIRKQSFQDFEIIIVDDGSTDGTEDTIKKIDLPIRYYWQENSGDAAARNKLIDLAHGEYIAFIDSDDLYTDDALGALVAAAEENSGNVISYGSYIGIDENGQITKKCKRKLYSGKITEQLFQDIFIHSCGSLFPRKAVNELRFDTSLKVCSDYDLWLQLSLKYKFVAVNEPTFYRRRHSGNLSAVSLKNIKQELFVLERFYYDRGGKNHISFDTAMKRISKEQYRVGKAATKEGFFDEAKEYLKKSFYTRFNLKALIWLIKVKFFC